MSRWGDMTPEQRFWSHVDSSGEHWLWTGATASGYGTFRYQGRIQGAHVVAFKLSGRVLQPGLFVLHTCDIRLCCRPDHLFSGTQADNVKDMMDKGRNATGARLNHPSQVGAANNGAKLTEGMVVEVKRLLASGVRQAEVARMTGVSRHNVWCIAHGKSWNHVGFDASAPALMADFARGRV